MPRHVHELGAPKLLLVCLLIVHPYQGTRPCPYRTSNRTNFKRLTHLSQLSHNSTASLKGKAIDIQLSKSRWHSHATSYSPIG